MTEADLYTIVKVARNEDLAEQIGRDRYFDLVDHNKVRSFRIKRWTPFNLFKEEVAKEFGIPIQFQRFWLWAKRQNNTYRPHRHVKPQQEAQPGLPKIPPTVCSDDILLFFKLYDPLKEELRYVGRFYVKADGMPVDILAKINRCDPVDKMVTFRDSQLGNGDIICFQISLEDESRGQCGHPNVPSFLEYVYHHQGVTHVYFAVVTLNLPRVLKF
ncbi:hypothetical protein RHGRI_014968 [Rhododendron griersonianum]|uniref:Ubiquitin carboxyl-terminal hydrolase 7 ICP0-binding domain-containing protein n=1 Tax=Rhododendron griersonianum TaxID=479676 RepID=A0AAV6KC04_9ERIC|nr:hypothetical protein RHGRI_014968 [Rhododendron griersonianum]